MKTKRLFLLISVLNALVVFSQKNNQRDFHIGPGVQMNYAYRSAHQIGVGLNLMLYNTDNLRHANLLCLSLDIDALFKHNFVSPNFSSSIEYLRWSKQKIGFQFSLTTEINNKLGFGASVKSGLNYDGLVYYFVGYNFFRLHESFDISPLSIGVNFRINWAIFDLSFH